jgi:thiosulfate/3-mercaptopyruvate sulfurtransferase
MAQRRPGRYKLPEAGTSAPTLLTEHIMATELVRKLKTAFAALLVAAFCAPAYAQQQIIVDTGFVADALDRDVLIWDVRSEEEYLRGHIPGAVNLGEIAAEMRQPGSEDYIPVSHIERTLGAAGIHPQRRMILYGSKAHTSPYFGYITMRWLGGGEAAYVYHGGIDDWKAAGKPLSTVATRLPPVEVKAELDPDVLVSTRELMAKLGDSSVQIIDARTVREFDGEDIRALRGGHVPGAINIPYETNWIDPDTPRKLARRMVDNKDGMNLKPREALAAMYAGLDPDKETIVYCQSGVRASESATVLKELGFRKVRVYDSSWLGWGNTFEAPVENVSYFNVSRVNAMINVLQSRIDQLEDELAELKAARERQQ